MSSPLSSVLSPHQKVPSQRILPAGIRPPPASEAELSTFRLLLPPWRSALSSPSAGGGGAEVQLSIIRLRCLILTNPIRYLISDLFQPYKGHLVKLLRGINSVVHSAAQRFSPVSEAEASAGTWGLIQREAPRL